MKLFYSPFHDFVHKVLVTAHEAGIASKIETVASFPFRDLDRNWVRGQYDTSAIAPLGKVPFLALDDGSVLYASPVVAEYLDGFNRHEPLFPADREQRFDALRRLTLGDALFDFAVLMSMEGWREEHERRADLYDWLWPKVTRVLDDAETSRDPGRFDIGDTALLQGLSYLDAWAGGNDTIPDNPAWTGSASGRDSRAGSVARSSATPSGPITVVRTPAT